MNAGKLNAIVQVSLDNLLGMNHETLAQYCLINALGKEDLFKYRVENYKCRLAGVLDLNILFEVTGELFPAEEPKPQKQSNKKLVKSQRKPARGRR